MGSVDPETGIWDISIARKRHKLDEVSADYFDDRIAVNLRPHFFATQAVLPSMRARGGGRIVNIGSGSWKMKSLDLSVYATAKSAMLGFTRVLARELGIPAAPDRAIQLAAAGRLRPIDLGLANGVPFALMAGVGFDAAVVRSVEPRIKSIVGAFAYIARGLSVLSKHPLSRFAVTADGERFDGDAWLAVVANAARYTYHWRLAPGASIDDGWLDMCLFESRSRAQTLGQVLAALRGRHVGRLGVHHLRARRFHIECHPPVSVQLDGDAAGRTPLDLDILPGALTVVVPR